MMDEYDRQWSDMQRYLPFLDKMIAKLERNRDKAKDPQLAKMKSLHHILTDTDKKLKLETLLKCQEVLVKLYQKVEGHAAAPGPSVTPLSATPASARPSRAPSPPRSSGRSSSDRRSAERRDDRPPRHDRPERSERGDRWERPEPDRRRDRSESRGSPPAPSFRPINAPNFARGGFHRPPAGRISPWQSSMGPRPPHPEPWAHGPPQRGPRPFWRGGRGGFEGPFRGPFGRSGPPRELVPPWSSGPPQGMGSGPNWNGPSGRPNGPSLGFEERSFEHSRGSFRDRGRGRDRDSFEGRFGGGRDDYDRDHFERSDFDRHDYERHRENGHPVASHANHSRQPSFRSDRGGASDTFSERHSRSPSQSRPSRWSTDDRVPPISEREPHRDSRSDRPSLLSTTRSSSDSSHPPQPSAKSRERRDPRVSSSSVIESPASPPSETPLDTPLSPPLETPASPPLDTPLSPSPASPSPSSPPPPPTIPINTPLSPQANQTSLKLQPKVIPLERQSVPGPVIAPTRLDPVLGDGLLPIPTSQPRGNGLLPTPRLGTPLPSRPLAPPQNSPSMRPFRPPNHLSPRLPMPSRGPPSDSRNSPFHMHKQFSTYGEYRKWKQEQDRLQSREQPEDSVPDSTTNGDASNSERNQAIASFKIPKKKRLNSSDESSSRASDDNHDDMTKESESDQSESELKIVETEDSHSESEDPPVPSQSIQKPPRIEPEAAKDRTQEMLKNIVAALEPEEAKKLLQRAHDLESAGKLSLKQLKYLLADDSDSDEPTPESEPSVAKTPVPEVKSSKKVVVPPTSNKTQEKSVKLGVRRSRRLLEPTEPVKDQSIESSKTVKPETTSDDKKALVKGDDADDDDSHGENNDDNDGDDDDDDQLVIDEGDSGAVKEDSSRVVGPPSDDSGLDVPPPSSPAPPSKRRGRPPKKLKLDPIVKTESNEKMDDDDDVPEPKSEPEVRTTRSQKGGKTDVSAPKSKTWFPGSLNSKTGSRKRPFTSPEPPAPDEANIVIKKEPKDPDLSVFTGTEDMVFEKREFIRKHLENAGEIRSSVKNRIGALKGLLSKLSQETDVQSNPKEQTETKTPAEVDEISPEPEIDLGPMIVTRSPNKYTNNISSLIDQLKTNVEDIPDEREDLSRNPVQKMDLLALVKGWKVDEIVFQAEENSSAQDQGHTSLPADNSSFVTAFNAKLQVERHWPDKLEEAKLAQLGPECISDLFKCAASHCAFSSDDAAEFRYHLDHIHASKPQQIDGDQCLECLLCLDQFVTSEMLVSHIVRDHGSARFQCPFCYYRSGSKLSLLVHQQNVHPDSKHGYFECRGILRGDQEDEDDEAALPLFTCNKCGKLCESELEFYDHLESHDPMGKQFDFVCPHCSRCCSNIQEFVFHSIQSHWDQPLKVLFRYFDLHARRLLEIEKTSSLSSDEYDACDESEETSHSSDEINTAHDKALVRSDGFKPVSMESLEGLEGRGLFQCGAQDCGFAGENVVQLKEHLATCLKSQSSLKCPHCDMSFKHVPTLLEHLKTHGKKRYACSLCSFRCSIPLVGRNHGRTVHKVGSMKIVPLIPGKNNPERDLFLVTPKHALPKPSSQQDTFSPKDLSKLVQRCSMSRYLLRCADCDFSTKVRKNLEKHLKLHLKHNREPPTITPINPPSNEDNNSFSKMTPLIDISEEEKAKAPLPEEEMAVLPMLVPETSRFTCSDPECNYSTIDDFMLLNHIMALHPDLSEYQCPHCPNDLPMVPFDDVEFHLRCHGDLLFRCGHCPYYHWQKRTAEKHVADEHPNRKQYVRDIRKEKEHIVPVPLAIEKKPAEKKPSEPFEYRPFKCSLCDVSESEMAKIREHCKGVHDMAHQYKCSMCQLTSDSKAELEKHIVVSHPQQAKSVTPIRMFYIDPSNSDSSLDEKRDPLWSRNMSGLKHIRGILYDEEPTTTNNFHKSGGSTSGGGGASGDKSKSFFKASHSQSSQPGDNPDLESKVLDEADHFPMECKECGIQKKTIKSLKMHIKLLHLRTGKFLCSRCQFSANILNSIHTHYKIQHPEAENNPDFEERTDETKAFSHEYWNTHWNIPTLLERKAIVEERLGVGQPQKKKKGRPKGSTKAAIAGGLVKRGRKRKEHPDQSNETPTAVTQTSEKEFVPSEPILSVDQQRTGATDVKATILTQEISTAPTSTTIPFEATGAPVRDKKTKERIMEISPFERIPTFKCAFCPKYSQIREKLERHVRCEHADKGSSPSDGVKTLTRDQVVDMLTAKVGSTSDYKCFFCDDVIGPIYEIRDHFNTEHPNDSLKVRSFTGKGVKGYLECQLCGHLTPGFERSKQKAHFHEDHPLESSVSASKYVSKTGTKASIEKVDLSRFIGTTMFCPKEDCKFEAKTLSAIYNHLKKHTQTYKCGQCGKTHNNLSDFHQHTAMMHGDKIPDLVKDPEAEAEFEALRGLFEAELIAMEEADISSNSKRTTETSTSGVVSKKHNVAKKSTSRQGKRNVARKSTGGVRISAVSVPFSIYGLNIEPLNLNEISTRMSISGMDITLSAKKMSELIPLDPRVLVRDLAIQIPEKERDEPPQNAMDTTT